MVLPQDGADAWPWTPQLPWITFEFPGILLDKRRMLPPYPQITCGTHEAREHPGRGNFILFEGSLGQRWEDSPKEGRVLDPKICAGARPQAPG